VHAGHAQTILDISAPPPAEQEHAYWGMANQSLEGAACAIAQPDFLRADPEWRQCAVKIEEQRQVLGRPYALRHLCPPVEQMPGSVFVRP
jgi:hypothetical protein